MTPRQLERMMTTASSQLDIDYVDRKLATYFYHPDIFADGYQEICGLKQEWQQRIRPQLKARLQQQAQAAEAANVVEANPEWLTQAEQAAIKGIINEAKKLGSRKRDIVREVFDYLDNNKISFPKYNNFDNTFPDIITRSEYSRLHNEWKDDKAATKHEKFT